MRQALTQQRPAGVALPDSVGECGTAGIAPHRGDRSAPRASLRTGVVRGAGTAGTLPGLRWPGRPRRFPGSAVCPRDPRCSSRAEAAPQHPSERGGAGRPLPPAPPWGPSELIPAFLLSTAPAGHSPQPPSLRCRPRSSPGVTAPTVTRF